MTRRFSGACRAVLAVVVLLLVQAVLHWAPVEAATFTGWRAAPLGALAVALAVLTGLTARERSKVRAFPLLIALASAAAALALVVAWRPPTGLLGQASAHWGPIGTIGAGPIDVIGRDLQHLEGGRRWTITWSGPLRVPEGGAYRLWATGRGNVAVKLDGRPVFAGEGDPLLAGGDVTVGPGSHTLEVHLVRVGGPRLRLGWTRPGADGRPSGRNELLPSRQLGEEIARAWWWATDLLAFLVAALVAALVWVVPWDAPRALPESHPWSRRELGLSVAGHLAVLALMSWPLVTDLSHLGVMDRPDGRLNAWILAWDVHALTHAPTRLFQAPAFFPLPDALAFSENLLLPSLLAAPGLWVSGPTLGYNLALLTSLLVSALGVQLLVRRESGDALAAFAAGVFFAAGAHRWVRLAHLHAQVTLFLPFVLLALDRFHTRRTLRAALVVGLLVALQGLSSVYLGAITVLMTAAAVGVGIAAGWRGAELRRLAAGLALAAALMAPALLPYLRMRDHQGVEFTMEDVSTYATTLTSYAASGTRLYGGVTQRHLPPEAIQDTLFPGLVVLILGLVGLARAPRRYAYVAVAASLLAILISLGPETAFYRFLHEHVVLVRGVRALSRFSLAAVLSLCVLAGFALAGRPRLTLLALASFLLESGNVPIRYASSAPPSETARFLAAGQGPVAVLPLGERDTEAMLEAVVHWRPLVNGDSGFIPRPYNRALESLQLPLTEDAARLLRGLGVHQVVTRQDMPWPLLFRAGPERVYAVPAGDVAREVVPGRAVPVRWTSAGPVLDLTSPLLIDRVAFSISDAAFVSETVVELSEDGRSWRPVPAWASLADATLSLVRHPRQGLAELSFPAASARFVRLSPHLPLQPGLAWVRVASEAGS